VIRAECWSHTRRYFERALDAEPQAAGEALQQIRAFYTVQEEIRVRGLEGAEKLALRTEKTLPKVQDFWRWCDEQCHRPDLTPTNPLSKALVYARERIEALQVFQVIIGRGAGAFARDALAAGRALAWVQGGLAQGVFTWRTHEPAGFHSRRRVSRHRVPNAVGSRSSSAPGPRYPPELRPKGA